MKKFLAALLIGLSLVSITLDASAPDSEAVQVSVVL